MKRANAARAVLLTLMLGLSACVTTPAQKGCDVSLQQRLDHVMHAVPGAQLQAWSGDAAQALIAVYNQLPPPSNFAGDTFILVVAPATPNGLLVIGSQGCHVVEEPWPLELIPQLFRAAGVL